MSLLEGAPLRRMTHAVHVIGLIEERVKELLVFQQFRNRWRVRRAEVRLSPNGPNFQGKKGDKFRPSDERSVEENEVDL